MRSHIYVLFSCAGVSSTLPESRNSFVLTLSQNSVQGPSQFIVESDDRDELLKLISTYFVAATASAMAMSLTLYSLTGPTVTVAYEMFI